MSSMTADEIKSKRVQLEQMKKEAQDFFEKMQEKYGGDLENMLESTRQSIQNGKVNVDVREQFDILR